MVMCSDLTSTFNVAEFAEGWKEGCRVAEQELVLFTVLQEGSIRDERDIIKCITKTRNQNEGSQSTKVAPFKYQEASWKCMQSRVPAGTSNVSAKL